MYLPYTVVVLLFGSSSIFSWLSFYILKIQCVVFSMMVHLKFKIFGRSNVNNELPISALCNK